MKRPVFAISLTLMLAGCARVGPDFRTPAAPVQHSWTEENAAAIEATHEMEIGPWWEHYQDDTLNHLVDYALHESYTLEAAAARIAAARANLGFAIGTYYPQVQQAEGSSYKTQLSANAPNTLNADRRYWDSVLGFRIAWELDFWGRFNRGVQAAYGEYAATHDDYRDVQRILISDIVIAYVQHKTFQKRIAILEDNIAIQYRSVQIAQVRWKEGYDSELDYAQAVTLWKETSAQKVRLEFALKQVVTTLALLTGLTPEEFSARFPINAAQPRLPERTVIGYPAEVLCRRPDIRRSLDLLYAQSARIGIAVSDLYPRLSFTGFLGLQCASDTHTTLNQGSKQLLNNNSVTFFYGPDFTWPILNYGRLKNRIREQYALLHEGIANYRYQVLEAYKEVEDALTFYVKSLEETEDLKESFKYAGRSVSISTLQYQEGLADYSRVLNSLQLQVTAEDNLAQTQGNIGLAYALIYKALGSF